jgi:hypothetical protein
VVKDGTPAQLSARRSLVDMIVEIQARHETGEQEFLWPTVRKVLDDGDDRAAEGLEQEARGEEILTALSRLDGTEQEFDELVEELSASSRKHVAFEGKVFLELTEQMSARDLRRLATKFARYGEHAPTRPHPHAPQRPAVAVQASAAMGGAMDRAKDAAAERPADRGGRPSARARKQTRNQEG